MNPSAAFSSQTLIEMLQTRAREQPESRAFTFLNDGEADEAHMGYAQLDARARAIAASLMQQGWQGQRAVLLYAPGLDYIAGFMGCMYAGVVAVPAYPPDPNRLPRTLPRLTAILQDSQASLILTTEAIRSMSDFLAGAAPGLLQVPWLATDSIASDLQSAYRPAQVTADHLAFLQYTSGSTGHPKGVMLSHRNLLDNLEVIRRGFEVQPGLRAGSWLPPYHDMGLIGSILGTLYNGAFSVLMSPLAFLQRPFRWLQAMSKYKLHVSGGPNFAYELCLKKIKPEQRDSLDLRTWALAFSGAEPVRPETIENFSKYFAPCGFRRESFYPCYGLAEATLMVTGSKSGVGAVSRHFLPAALKKGLGQRAAVTAEGQLLASSGVRFPELNTRIVDPETRQELPEGKIGEIWVQGTSIAQGYWNQAEPTQQTFAARTAQGSGPFLRTGDLGFFDDRELFVTGRIKDLIIVRGANHYPQDIELTVERVDPIFRSGCGAAFSFEDRDEECLAIVQEVEGSSAENFDWQPLIARLRQAVIENHDLQADAVVLIKKGSLPKTSSGKVRRHACSEEFLGGQLEVVAEYRAQKKTSPAPRSAQSTRPVSPSTDRSPITSWLRQNLAERLGLKPEQIDADQPFSNFGLDSKEAVGLSGDLEEYLGRSLSPTLLWQYPSLNQLAAYLENPDAKSQGSSEVSFASDEPIAVVGLGCRFPQAPDPEAFWRLLQNGVDAVSEVPAQRWDVQQYYDSEPATPGKMNTRWGAFLENVDGFDAAFFGISPREAARMDPQQRILLEVAWQALENAGIDVSRLAGSSAGVFVGISGNDYAKFLGFEPKNLDAYTGTGNAHSIAANRLSYFLDLRGPSIAVDTACSSSLVAVHLACESLRRGESSLALAGGVNLLLTPELTVTFSQARMMSSEGHCKTFDADADGYVRGEGCGMVVLKRLSDAQRDGDRILALVKGSAVNQDGRSNGLTAPNGQAQRQVIRQALRRAGVAPAQISYVEAHGTGTPLGDPIEMESLGDVLQEGRSADAKCWVGSVKTNFGHLEAAAGIAGLIKVILALVHGTIPRHLHFKKINPHIPLERLPLAIPQQATPWTPQNEPRCAGVSSFGFGGTNAHLVLQSAPEAPEKINERERPLQLLKLSAKSPEALRGLCQEYALFLEAHPEISLADLAHAANVGRVDFEQRQALLFDSREELLRQLQHPPAPTTGAKSSPKIAFLYTGQGSQFVGMGKELFETHPRFRKILLRCEELLRPYLERPLLEVMFGVGADSGQLDETAYTQPALYSLAWALTECWAEWGIHPQAVMGHSVGEYAAAALAGVFSWEEGLRLIAERAALMQSLPKDGAMLALVAEPAQVREWIAPYLKEVSIAAVNGPRSVVVSGDRARLTALAQQWRAEGVAVQELQVSHAFHSPKMESILEAFQKKAGAYTFSGPQLEFISNLSGQAFPRGQAPDAEYFRRHLRQPVLFQQGIQTLIDSGTQIFIEIGPQPTLSALGKRCVTSSSALWLPSFKRGMGEWRSLAASVAELYRTGIAVDWRGWDRDYARRPCVLPYYPFQRESFWLEAANAALTEKSWHPLLQTRLPSALGGQIYGGILEGPRLALFQDHRIGGEILFPAAAFLELAMAAVRDFAGGNAHRLKDFSIDQALILDETGKIEIQVVLQRLASGELEFKIFSRQSSRGEAWTSHARGQAAQASFPVVEVLSFQELQQGLSEFPIARFYETLGQHGLNYGKNFQGISGLWFGDGSSLAQIKLPEGLETGDFVHHPVAVDAAIQAVAAALGCHEASTFVPVGFATVESHGSLPERCYAWTRVAADSGAGLYRQADIVLFGDKGQKFLEIQGLRLKSLNGAMPSVKRLEALLYRPEWVEKEKQAPVVVPLHPVPQPGLWWVQGSGDLADRFSAALRAKGKSVLQFRADDGDLKAIFEKDAAPPQAWVRVFADEAPPEAARLKAAHQHLKSFFEGIHALQNRFGTLPSIWGVTRGVYGIGGESSALRLELAPLWGMARSFDLENGGGLVRMMDLPSTSDSKEVEFLLLECLTPDAETQMAWRTGKRWVPRLLPQQAEPPSAQAPAQTLAPSEPFRLEILEAGTLEGARARRCVRRAPEAEELEIEVAASGLNFSDVLKVLGLYPGVKDLPVPLGAECAGRVVALGSKVSGFQVGDEVMAIAPFSFGRFVTTPAQLAVRKPSKASFIEAATIPVAFLTAYYAIRHLANLQKGEKILIHAAAGGVGLAALQIAQQLGAEVFATAGSEAKRQFLRAQGVKHVMDSRSLDFAQEIKRATGGQGVDAVLNSLSGEFIPKSLEVLAPYGRFLEIGKTDIYQDSRVGLAPFQNSLSYFAIDLDRMFRDRRPYIASLFSELAAYFERGEYRPLPHTDFSISDATSAFRYMAQRKNTGKIILQIEGVGVSALAPSGSQLGIKPDGVYLVTGAAGALGKVVVEDLVRQGARRLALLGRHQPDASFDALKSQGVDARWFSVDVADCKALQDLFNQQAFLKELRGIYHCAGSLSDGLLLQQSWQDFENPLPAKIDGAYHLHSLTRALPLDFFVMFSSLASVLGSPGQANYSSANAFLDALAAERLREGRPALSINWGPWAGEGMAGADLVRRNLAKRGLRPLSREDALAALRLSSDWHHAQTVVADVDWETLQHGMSPKSPVPLLEALLKPKVAVPVEAKSNGETPLREQFAKLDATQIQSSLQTHIQGQVARVLGVDPGRLDPNQPLNSLGLDSLMAIELKNEIEGALQVVIPIATLLKGPSLADLAQQLVPQLSSPQGES